MSIFATLSVRSRKPRRRWFVVGFALSLALHLSALVYYLWTPEYDFAPPPQAAPIKVTIVASLAMAKMQVEDTEIGENQPEIVQEQMIQAATVEEIQPLVKPTPVKEQPKFVEVEKANALSSAINQEARPEKETKNKPEEPKQIAKTPVPPKSRTEPTVVKKTKPKVIPDPQKAMVKPVPIEKPRPISDDLKDQQQVVQTAKSQPNLMAKNSQQQASALRIGQLSEAGKAAKINWQQALHAHLEREKRYPRKAKRMKKKGMPVIKFTMDRQGNVVDVVLVKSSGTLSLDNEAVDLVYRAQPLIKPPTSIAGTRLSLTLPINFSF
ncbi:energy transducer TonB family protein [Vibrio gigantis]|uniref:Energy transducer TonB n=1 Tax=Vibrio gigantis TaxID=296199 RepID=A0A5M9P336_9VIBR|nr:energy transducer TonB [Vibrio gigantis]KAA8679512.1 energy transducer TonB [Vibrio gigantis]